MTHTPHLKNNLLTTNFAMLKRLEDYLFERQNIIRQLETNPTYKNDFLFALKLLTIIQHLAFAIYHNKKHGDIKNPVPECMYGTNFAFKTLYTAEDLTIINEFIRPLRYAVYKDYFSSDIVFERF